jgi:signal transduction histidine kinase
MRERAEMFRGSVQVQSQPGNGTTILVRMPIQEGD